MTSITSARHSPAKIQISSGNLHIAGKKAAQITTSKHFYDVTALAFIKENCQDISADAKEINESRYAKEREKEIADAKAVLENAGV